MNRDEILALLCRYKREHAGSYGVTALGVFGSVARGTFNDESDIDVVFQSERPNLFRTAHMKRELEDLLGRSIDIVRLRERMNPRLKQRIEQEACYV